MPETHRDTSRPSIGYILIGGALVGSQVRDIRLANELSRRGCRSHVWWAMERPRATALDPAITQGWLFHAARYSPIFPTEIGDGIGHLAYLTLSDSARVTIGQRSGRYIARQMKHLVRRVCEGVETDKRLIARFARQIAENGTDFLLPNLAIFAPFVAAALRGAGAPGRYAVTFQGYELYSRYAREIGLGKKLFERFREAVAASDAPAITVSEDYRQRVHADIGIPLDRIVVIPPGVPEEKPLEESHARALISAALPDFDPELPLVSYIGRQDSEKGIDLLLYAAKLLCRRGLKFQVAVCGATAFGREYARLLPHLADQMEMPVLFHGFMTKELRTAIFQTSRCTVYPSVHREPFGMVPVESMILGTPAIVADTGGVAELVRDGDRRGGLTFQTWDSGDLADKLEMILRDDTLARELAHAAPGVAGRYSVQRISDRTLDLITGSH